MFVENLRIERLHASGADRRRLPSEWTPKAAIVAVPLLREDRVEFWRLAR